MLNFQKYSTIPHCVTIVPHLLTRDNVPWTGIVDQLVIHRIRKLLRIMADGLGSRNIQSAHLAEALQYHPMITVGPTSIVPHISKLCKTDTVSLLFE